MPMRRAETKVLPDPIHLGWQGARVSAAGVSSHSIIVRLNGCSGSKEPLARKSSAAGYSSSRQYKCERPENLGQCYLLCTPPYSPAPRPARFRFAGLLQHIIDQGIRKCYSAPAFLNDLAGCRCMKIAYMLYFVRGLFHVFLQRLGGSGNCRLASRHQCEFYAHRRADGGIGAEPRAALHPPLW